MDREWNDVEILFLDMLAQRLMDGKRGLPEEAECVQKLGIDRNRYDLLVGTMNQAGFIERHHGSGAVGVSFCSISPLVILEVRKVALRIAERNAPTDRVAGFQTYLRQSRFTAWFILLAIGLAAVLTVANQAIQLLQNLGLMDKSGGTK